MRTFFQKTNLVTVYDLSIKIKSLYDSNKSHQLFNEEINQLTNEEWFCEFYTSDSNKYNFFIFVDRFFLLLNGNYYCFYNKQLKNIKDEIIKVIGLNKIIICELNDYKYTIINKNNDFIVYHNNSTIPITFSQLTHKTLKEILECLINNHILIKG